MAQRTASDSSQKLYRSSIHDRETLGYTQKEKHTNGVVSPPPSNIPTTQTLTLAAMRKQKKMGSTDLILSGNIQQ